MGKNRYDLIILGGGMAGLGALWAAKKKGLSALLLEKSNRVGGAVRTQTTDGYLLELGPNTIQAQPALWEMIQDAGLEEDLQIAPASSNRYVLYKHKLRTLPTSPSRFFFSSLLSTRGKLRLLMEPLIPRGNNADESVDQFIRRRMGAQAAERLMAPFISGVWAGDIERLSIQAAFSRLTEWEKSHGSVVKGMIRSGKRRTQKVPKGLISFKGGLETLPKTLLAKNRNDIVLNAPVQEVRHRGSKQNRSVWMVSTDREKFTTGAVISTLSGTELSPLVSHFSNEMAQSLKSISYAPVRILYLGIRRESIKHSLNGFGYLAAPSENEPILGCLFSSSLFPGRAPSGQCLLTVFTGGTRNPEKHTQSREKLIHETIESIHPILGIRGNPDVISVISYDRAIPQYDLAYPSKEREWSDFENKFPGFYIAGNIRGGISVGAVVQSATNIVDRISKS